jgi:hypothetical protein
VVERLRQEGWEGVWVSVFGGWLRREWFPAPAYQTLGEAGAPGWAVWVFEELRVANGGRLSGFFDVFAWRAPGEVRFVEVKVGPHRILPNQRQFLETALRFHRPERFMIVEIARARPRKRQTRQESGHSGPACDCHQAVRPKALQTDPSTQRMMGRPSCLAADRII